MQPSYLDSIDIVLETYVEFFLVYRKNSIQNLIFTMDWLFNRYSLAIHWLFSRYIHLILTRYSLAIYRSTECASYLLLY